MANSPTDEAAELARMKELGRFAAPYFVLYAATQLTAALATRHGMPTEGQVDDCIKRALYLVQKVVG